MNGLKLTIVMFLIAMPLMGCANTVVKVESPNLPYLSTRSVETLARECEVNYETDVCIDIVNLYKHYKKLGKL